MLPGLLLGCLVGLLRIPEVLHRLGYSDLCSCQLVQDFSHQLYDMIHHDTICLEHLLMRERLTLKIDLIVYKCVIALGMFLISSPQC